MPPPLGNMFHRCLLYYIFVRLLTAEQVPCNVTEDNGGTLYSVPEFTGEECQYQWNNGTVLANNFGKMKGVVVTSSNWTLVTHKCWEQMNYKIECISERSPRTATCTCNCTRDSENTGVPSDVIPVIVLCILGPLVLLVLLGFVLYKIGFPNCRYAAVNQAV